MLGRRESFYTRVVSVYSAELTKFAQTCTDDAEN